MSLFTNHKAQALICLNITALLLLACNPSSLASQTPVPRNNAPTNTSTITATQKPTSSATSIPTLTSTPDIWKIQNCPTAPSVIGFEYNWLWYYTGDIEGRGEVNMLLNFPKSNEILGFYFDFPQHSEYQVNGCVVERVFTIWLSQGDRVEAIIQGEFPATDPRGFYSSSEILKGDVLTGSLIEKGNLQGLPIYLSLLMGTAGTIEHRFRIAGVEDDTVILNASKQFLGAIANNDYDQVAQMILFPLKVQKDGITTEIQTPDSLLLQYDEIFDAGFKARLLKTFSNNLLAEAGHFIGTIGLAIYDGGGISFDDHGRVTAIYNWQKPTPTPSNSISDLPVMIGPKPSPTLPPECGTTTLGKPGTQDTTASTQPPILVQGTIVLCIGNSLFSKDHSLIMPFREAMLDLDSGYVDMELADIAYDQTGTMDFDGLYPVNGALAITWSLSIKGLPPQPTYNECKQQINTYYSDNEPGYVCVITNEGHVSRLKVEKFQPLRMIPSLEVSFVTWSEVVEKP